LENRIKFLNKFLVQKSTLTANFYNDLVNGKNTRLIVGLENRYNIEKPRQIEMLEKYFDPVLDKLLNSQSNLLDYGCGNGFFTKRVAHLCKSVTGVDISEEFIFQAKMDSPTNSSFEVIRPQSKQIKSRDNFNVCLMVDVIHHLETPETDLKFLSKFFRKDNRVIIFEPNIMNPAIFFMHLMDKNERGLLRFLRKKNYLDTLSEYIEVESIQYNGILIGPANKLTNAIVAIINYRLFKPFINWLNPKIQITGRFKL